MAQVTETYQYSPLDSETLQIRLVELQPGSWSDEVRCTVKIVDFDTAPPYECLSYVWGDPKAQITIQICGKPFKITENLWTAMRRLRYSDAPRVLWIDAISIHQKDDDEKAKQVQKMGDIYKKCHICTIWLGEDAGITNDNLTSTVAQQVAEMLHMLAKGSHLNEMPCFLVIEGQRTDIPESYKPNFQALAEFLSLPWWRRIWIIQEMALPKTIKFVYSSEEFSYDLLRSAVETLNSHAGACCKDVRTSLRAEAFDPLLAVQEQVDPLVSIREIQKQLLQTTLSQLRRQFHASQATNVVDLFYGLLGLVNSWPSKPLLPDYKANARKAIAEAVYTCVLEEGGMETLIGQRTLDGSRDFPSWIPDACCTSTKNQWVTIEERRLTMASNFSASGAYMQDTSILAVAEDNQTLRIQTKFVDKIEKFGPTCDALGDWQNAPDVLRQWMEMVGLGADGWPQEPPATGSQGDILWRTLMNNSIETDNKERLTYRSATQDDYYPLKSLWNLLLLFSGFISGPLRLDLDSHEKLQIEGSTTIYHVVVCLLQRRLFVTKSGMIGLASGDIKVGDEVRILLGCQTPFILRSSNEASNKWDLPLYTVIGNAYVHQVMYGEAFDDAELGPVQAIVLE